MLHLSFGLCLDCNFLFLGKSLFTSGRCISRVMSGSCEGWLCGFCLAFSNAPRVVGSCQCSHRRRAYAVPAHVHLLSFCEGLAVGAVADDVVTREALGLVQLGRLQHPQADVDDHIRRAFDRHSDQCQAVGGVVMVVGAGTACSLIAGVAVADP